jgi:hypothetical protein
LESLAVVLPPRRVELGRSGLADASLAIPSAPALIELVCGPSDSADRKTLVVGRVRDVSSGAPVQGAGVAFTRATWTVRGTVSGTAFRNTTDQVAAAVSDSTGMFRVCGLPPRVPLNARASAGRASGSVDVSLPNGTITYVEIGLTQRPMPR